MTADSTDSTELVEPQNNLSRWSAYTGLAACGYSALLWLSYALTQSPSTHYFVEGLEYPLGMLALIVLPVLFLTSLVLWIACVGAGQRRGWTGPLLAFVAALLFAVLIVFSGEKAQRDLELRKRETGLEQPHRVAIPSCNKISHSVLDEYREDW